MKSSTICSMLLFGAITFHLPFLLVIILSLFHTPFSLLSGPILEFLDEWGTENLDMVDIREIANPKTTKVFVNGNWVGVHRDPEDLIGELHTQKCGFENSVLNHEIEASQRAHKLF